MVGGTIRRKVIHRESFRASVLHLSENQAVLQSIAAKKSDLTTPSLLSSATRGLPVIQAKCREGALNRLRRRSFLREPTVRVQVESESVNIEAANEHSQATPALKSVAVERNLPERCASLPPWHGLHKKRESLLEALVSGFAALVVSQTYHNEVVRRDDQSGLAARTRHIERLLGHGILAVAIDPEEAAINRALVSFPGRRQRTDKFDVPVGQNPLTVPDSILKIEIAKAGPVPRRRELVPLRQEISKRVRFQYHRPDADLVEESALREGQIILPPFLDAKSNEVVNQHRVGVVITAHRVGRPL